MAPSQAHACGCTTPTSPPPVAEEPSTQASTCYCPIDGIIETISRKYAMQVVSLVGDQEPVRFKDLEARFTEASTATLSNRLEQLTEAGILTRRSYDEVPPRVEYRLTPAGRELQRRLQPLLAWASDRE